jgi:hypothetical protein
MEISYKCIYRRHDHDIAKIVQKLALNTNYSANYIDMVHVKYYKLT